MCLNKYKRDPVYFVSAPGLAWQAWQSWQDWSKIRSINRL